MVSVCHCRRADDASNLVVNSDQTQAVGPWRPSGNIGSCSGDATDTSVLAHHIIEQHHNPLLLKIFLIIRLKWELGFRGKTRHCHVCMCRRKSAHWQRRQCGILPGGWDIHNHSHIIIADIVYNSGRVSFSSSSPSSTASRTTSTGLPIGLRGFQNSDVSRRARVASVSSRFGGSTATMVEATLEDIVLLRRMVEGGASL